MQKHNKHFLSEAAWKFHGVEAVALQKERNPIVTPERNNNKIACSLILMAMGIRVLCMCVQARTYLRTCIFLKTTTDVWWWLFGDVEKTEHQTMSLYQYIFFYITHKYTHFNLFSSSRLKDTTTEKNRLMMWCFIFQLQLHHVRILLLLFTGIMKQVFFKEREDYCTALFYIFARDSF